MKKGKIILLVVLVMAAIAGAGFFGLKYGVGLMQNGLVANYPTVKNIVHGAATEFDSTATITLTKADDEALFDYLKGDLKSDTLQFSIPYYGRYAVDLSFRNFRVFKNEEEAVEVWLPACVLRYCELKFDGLVVNGKPSAALFKSDSGTDIRTKLYAYLIPVIENNKANQKAGKLAATKALMLYFMPYKLDLKVYIANQQQTLPVVPGANQTVDEAIKEAFNP